MSILSAVGKYRLEDPKVTFQKLFESGIFDFVNFEEYAKLCKLRDQVGDYWKQAPGDTDDSGCKVLDVYEHVDAFLDCFDELKEEAGILLSAACAEEALISFRKICSQVSEGASI